MRWLDAKNLIVILTDDYMSVFPFSILNYRFNR